MPAFAVDQPTGTVTDPVWGSVVGVLFLSIAFVVIAVAVGALIREGWRRYREAQARLDRDITAALNDAELYSLPKPLPSTTRTGWFPDTETPIGNQLLREYACGVR